MAGDAVERSRRATNYRRGAIASSALCLLLLLVLLQHGCGGGATHGSGLLPQTKLDGRCVPRFAMSLPVFGPAGSIPRVDAAAHSSLTVTMMETDQQVLPSSNACITGGFQPTRVWAYQTTDSSTGAMLGPAHWPAVTIVAQRGTATRAEYVNDLPSFNPQNPTGPGLVQGVLQVDQTVHWADPLKSGCGMEMSMQNSSASPCLQQYIGPVPATVHLHGAELPAAYDGDPESWFTPNGLKGADFHSIGDPGPGKAVYEYPNSQEPGTLWFHDHALGITRLNVYAGLAGFYFLKDPAHEPQGYPSGAYEIEMAVQDRNFDTNGQLYLLDQQHSNDHPFWSPIFEGDVAVVNGAAFPYLNVEPRRYRFHVLNGSLNRGFSFVFGGAPVYIVGGDDNYFDTPVPLPAAAAASGVGVSPGERTDVIVDFSKFAGRTVELTNTRKGQDVDLPEIMQFRVAASTSTPDTSCDPASPDASTGLCARKYPLVRLTDGKGNVAPGVKIDKVRQLILYDYVLPSGHADHVPKDIVEYTNNTGWNGLESPSIALDFPTDGISELPRVGSVEMWEIVYLTTMKMGSHPVHLHLSQFQVLNRQPIDGSKYLTAWTDAFGAKGSSTAPLPMGCRTIVGSNYCVHYGPPLDYLTPNQDGALGGNLGFKSFFATDPKDSTVLLPTLAPTSEEQGWKDTAEVGAQQILRILVRWTPSSVPLTPNVSYAGQNFYEFDPTVGYYVWHCHVLTHEDNEMMRPYRVMP